MAPGRKNLFTGLAVFVGGLLLWQFGLDVEIVVFNPSKIGVVMMVIGALEALWGLYRMRAES
ncbi:DUF5708 family protein [Nonomuraea sp. ATR24]|uniref:DUF5708 family protein n=1 Tax=Nonomuraea TaxID=83681 RepID=UPI001C604D82|nr:DUF5708 family protein [Nonomuraea ceibae]